ncbi:MAG: DNA polymerase IV [Gemmatimonadetes bacterium]|nr:DNA polymerase IV [Gemmatimonadota bacterium]
MAAPPRVLLADADQFFVAVARLVDPEGAGRAKLLIVGGTPGSRGVVCSASYETRAFGVRSAMPLARALRLCPQATCIPVPRGACSTKSREIKAVLERFTPVVRGASVDEWYLDMGGTEALYHHEPLEVTAHRIRDAVLAETGITVSFGGGTNRLIAKLAVEFAKPKPGTGRTGVHIVAPGDEARFMAERVTLADIPGIGPRLQQALAERELLRVADVLPHDRTALERWFGRRTGSWLWERVRGIGGHDVSPRAAARSVSREDTFERDLDADADIEAELRRLAAKVAADLRDDGLIARTVTVRLKYTDFSRRSMSRTLRDPVESDRAITDVAVMLLAALRRKRKGPVRLAGVALSGLADAADRQISLLDNPRPTAAKPAPAAETPTGTPRRAAPPVPAPETERDRTVSRVVDAVRKKFGKDALSRGSGRKR